MDFKNTVFHEAFCLFLKDVAKLSDTSYEVLFGDQVTRVLFPYIHLISADYEEQYVYSPLVLWSKNISYILRRCVMSLIRGLGGHHPCPVCLVPASDLTRVDISYTRRVAQTAQNIVWNKHLNAGQKDILLKEKSLRNVEV